MDAATAGVNGKACVFGMVPSAWRAQWVGAIHAMGLTCVDGDWDDALFRGRGLTDADRRVSEVMMKTLR